MTTPQPRVALVTTLLLPKGSSSVLASFVKWHTGLGIDALYLYFDDDASDEPEGWREDLGDGAALGMGVGCRARNFDCDATFENLTPSFPT